MEKYDELINNLNTKYYEDMMYKLALQKIDNMDDADIINTEIATYRHEIEKMTKSIEKIQGKTKELEDLIDRIELLENFHIDASKQNVDEVLVLLRICRSEILALSEKRHSVSKKLQKLIEKKGKVLRVDKETLEREISNLGENSLTFVLKMENQERKAKREEIEKRESEDLLEKYEDLEGSKTYKRLKLTREKGQ